jgi:hypothetical protein
MMNISGVSHMGFVGGHLATAHNQHPSGEVSGGSCETLSQVNAVAENTRSSSINDNLTPVVNNA